MDSNYFPGFFPCDFTFENETLKYAHRNSREGGMSGFSFQFPSFELFLNFTDAAFTGKVFFYNPDTSSSWENIGSVEGAYKGVTGFGHDKNCTITLQFTKIPEKLLKNSALELNKDYVLTHDASYSAPLSFDLVKE